jgi:hypothetical protein
MNYFYLLSIAWPILLAANVDGAASFDPTVFCSRIVPFGKVCATAMYTSPSPAMLENGTTFYIGGYSTTYTIVKGLDEGEMFDGNPIYDAGITIDVIRDDSDACTISVMLNGNTTKCTRCKYCGDESYKADCSNVKYGRMMNTCESAEEEDVFFPLTAMALPKMNPPVPAPLKGAPTTRPQRPPVVDSRQPPVVRAPINRAPRRPPVAAPRRAPVMAPRRPPVAAPRQAPVMAPRRPPVAAPRRAPIMAPRRPPATVPVRA